MTAERDIIGTPLHKVIVGDTLVQWRTDDAFGTVTAIDVKARTYTVKWDDEDAPTTRHWQAPNNMVRRLRREGEVLDWEVPLIAERARQAEAEQLPAAREATAVALAAIFDDGHLGRDLAPRLTCDEADALTAFLVTHGKVTVAAAMLAHHATTDEEGDAHFNTEAGS